MRLGFVIVFALIPCLVGAVPTASPVQELGRSELTDHRVVFDIAPGEYPLIHVQLDDSWWAGQLDIKFLAVLESAEGTSGWLATGSMLDWEGFERHADMGFSPAQGFQIISVKSLSTDCEECAATNDEFVWAAGASEGFVRLSLGVAAEGSSGDPWALRDELLARPAIAAAATKTGTQGFAASYTRIQWPVDEPAKEYVAGRSVEAWNEDLGGYGLSFSAEAPAAGTAGMVFGRHAPAAVDLWEREVRLGEVARDAGVWANMGPASAHFVPSPFRQAAYDEGIVSSDFAGQAAVSAGPLGFRVAGTAVGPGVPSPVATTPLVDSQLFAWTLFQAGWMDIDVQREFGWNLEPRLEPSPIELVQLVAEFYTCPVGLPTPCLATGSGP